MKILHICTGWPLSARGGITNYVRAIAKLQSTSNNEVYVLGAPDKEQYEFHYIPYTSSKIVPFTCSPLIDKNGLLYIKKLIEAEQFDIIHIHALEYIDWDIYSVLEGKKYIVSLHDYCFICPRVYMFTKQKTACDRYDEKKCKQCISYLDRIQLLNKLVGKINRKLGVKLTIPHIKQNITTIRYNKFMELLNNAAYVLPVSYKVEEIYQNSGVTTKSKVLHIGNISADTFTKEFDYNLNPHIIKIVFLGRLTEYKGAELFFYFTQSLKQQTNVQFYFLGYAGQYEDKLRQLGIKNCGKYNQDDLYKLLKEYDLGMVLSIWHDNGPQVVMELLNNHVPVIGTKMGGIPDFVNFDNGYLFNPYSKEELLKTVEFIKSLTPADIYKMKCNIQRTTTTKEHFLQLMEIYNEVVCKKADLL